MDYTPECILVTSLFVYKIIMPRLKTGLQYWGPSFLLTTMTILALAQCGDIEVNPGPDPTRTIPVLVPLSFFVTNIDGLRNKITNLKAELDFHYDIIAIGESKLGDNVEEKKLAISGYSKPLRLDRPTGGGGVAMYVSNRVGFKQLEFPNHVPNIEFVAADIIIDHHATRVCIVYRPPSEPVSWLGHFRNFLEDLCNTENDLHLFGDFNYDFLIETKCKSFRNLINQFNLRQLVTEPTRVTEDGETLIDLFMSRKSNQNFTNLVSVGSSFASDHRTLRVHTSLPEKTAPIIKTTWLVDNADTPNLNQAIAEHDWSFITDDSHSMDDITNRFLSNLDDILRAHVPVLTYRLRSKDKPWMNGQIRREMNKRDRFERRAHKCKTRETRKLGFERFRKQRNLVNSLIDKAENDYTQNKYDRSNDSVCGSPDWWRLIKSLTKQKPDSIPALSSHSDSGTTSYANDNKSKANLLNDTFISNSNIDDQNTQFPRPDMRTHHRLHDVFITISDVMEILQDLNIHKCAGPDGIPGSLLRAIAETLAPPLTTLYNESLRRESFPSCWKDANIIPVYKKGDKSEPGHYRPIALTSIFSKVFERAFLKHFLPYLTNNNLIYKYQAGFLPGHSTLHQLLEIYHKIVTNLVDGLNTTFIFCDISKAFERVSHPATLLKLESYGISPKIISWFKSFLTGRRQRTCVGGEYSDWGNIMAGVPQGSVLGPILFLLFINDLPDAIQTDTRLFADDTSMMYAHQPLDDITATINEDLQRLDNWSKIWLVDLNPTKTKCMQVNLAINSVTVSPSMDNTPIDVVDHHKHLGVLLNNRANWTHHIDYIIAKISRRIGILRSLKFKLNRQSLRTIYMTHIRSILEYCGPLWDNCTDEQSDKLESLQREAARIITGLPQYCSNENLLTECGLPLLETRRRSQRLTNFYNIVHNERPQYLFDLLPEMRRDATGRTLRNAEDITTLHGRLETHNSSFLPQCIKDWNGPDLIPARSAPTISSFKRRIRPAPIPLPYLNPKPRYASIIYTQIKYESTRLNANLYRVNLVESPQCLCQTGDETVTHFLFHCPLYARQRDTLLDALASLDIHNPSFEILFDCTRHLSSDVIPLAQHAVYNYILSSNRFR